MKTKLMGLLFIILSFLGACSPPEDVIDPVDIVDPIENEPVFPVDPVESVDPVQKYDFRGIKIIAHKGFWKPIGNADNSLPAVQLAWENKMHGASVDIRMSSDSILYLNHDAMIKGYIIRQTPSYILDQLDLGNGQPLPRFDTFLEMVKNYQNFILTAELKSEGSSNFKKYFARTVAQRLMDAGLQDRIQLSSFDMRILEHIGAYNPSIKTRFIAKSKSMNFQKLKAAHVNAVSIRYDLIMADPNFVQYLVSRDFEVGVWTVNNIPDILRLKELPISSISTDIPDAVMRIYK